ncbi:hypothetical protein ACQ9Y2_11470 [Pseudomonas palleroniana]
MSQTSGTLTAAINNPQVTPSIHPFTGDADRMMMYFLGPYLHIAASQQVGPNINEVLGIDMGIKDVPADGVMRTYKIAVDADATYWASENYAGVPYSATGGSISVSLDSADRLVGNFNFPGQNGSKSVQVSQGTIDLSGFITDVSKSVSRKVMDTGHMIGTIVGGPLPDPNFNATVVNIQKVQSTVDYWQVIGQQVDGDIAHTRTWILIVVPVGTTDTEFDLSPSSPVRVTLGSVPSLGFAHVVSGKIRFTSMPATGRAAGDIDCLVQKNQESPIRIKVSFDILDTV